MNSTTDTEALLEHLNSDLARVMSPAMVYIGVLMLLGFLGNGMVWYFYGCKSKQTAATVFILALATFDLISCLISMPVEIADLRYYIVFKSEATCKIFEFVNHFAAIASAFALVAIAADRYRRICCPFEKQLEIKYAKILCGVCAVLALLVSWPSLVFATILRYDIPNSYSIQIEGYDCGSTKEENIKSFVFAFNLILLIGFICITIVLSVLYTLIAKQLFRHKKFRFYVSKKSLKRTSSGQTVSLSDFSSDPDSDIGNPEARAEIKEERTKSSNRIFDDPPDATGSMADLREFVTRGMPEVEGDRPTSGYTVVTGVTGLTDQSGKSKKSVQSIKSVTICDPSQNQVYSIEARENKEDEPPAPFRPGSGKSDSTWSNSINRPGSASSLATFSSRPSSASSRLTESTRPGSGNRENNDLSNRPPSGRTERSRSSKGSRRSNVVTPVEKTIVASIGSRASTVKRMVNISSSGSQKINTDTDNVKDLRMKMLDINTIKYTVIMLVITVVFVVSFLPHICLIIWRFYKNEFEVQFLNDPELIWYNIGVRSFFLNSVLNPFIYGFFNSKFRAFFYTFCCTCCIRKNKQRGIRRTNSAISSEGM